MNTTRIFFRDGLISLCTETDRWDDTYDSTWYQPEGPGKFLVTERKKGVNPYLPSKFLEYTFKDDLLTDILCYTDSIRAGNNQEGVAHYVFERYSDPDRHSLIKTQTFLTNIDMPAFSRTADCHKLVNEYDNKGNLVSRSIYDQDDKPSLDRYGVFRIKFKYDGDDNETEADYYDTRGQLTITAWGFAERYREYKRGFPETEKYYLDQSTLARSTRLADSVSIITYKYDQQGNETEKAFFDPTGYPLANASGFQEIKNEYSPSGMLMLTKNIGLNALTGNDRKQFLSYRYERDEQGRLVAASQVDNQGLAIADPRLVVFLIRLGYDPCGRVSSISFWLRDSVKMTCTDGYQESRSRYNDDGQLVETDFYDQNGHPTKGKIGLSRLLITYNDQALIAERKFYDGDNPVEIHDNLASLSNCHSIRYGYDLFNRVRTVEFYDRAGHPANAVLRAHNKPEQVAQRIDLNYNGARLMDETIRDSGNVSPTVTWNCANGDCLPLTAFESVQRVNWTGNSRQNRTYRGRIKPDSVFDDQFSFVGHDSVLLFLTENSRLVTGITCSYIYRLAPVNKYYQFEGQVTDFYMETHSVAGTYSYKGGKLSGPTVLYYRNGKVREKGEYLDNARTGVWDYFYDNGQKAKSIQFNDSQPLLIECYSKSGEQIARDGNGNFEGVITTNTATNPLDYNARGGIKGGLPDGEWFLSNTDFPWLTNTELFSSGKFQHGVFQSRVGRKDYSEKYFSRVESIHLYESLDHYGQELSCQPMGMASLMEDLYPEIKSGFADILKTNKYKDYSGWVFMDLRINGAGHVTSSYIRLYQPNEGFENNIRAMASRLTYPAYPAAYAKANPTIVFEKFYFILVEANEVVIPEQILENQRRR